MSTYTALKYSKVVKNKTTQNKNLADWILTDHSGILLYRNDIPIETDRLLLNYSGLLYLP